MKQDKVYIGKVSCTGAKNTPLAGLVAENIDLTLDFTGVDDDTALEIMCHASSIRVRIQNEDWKKLSREQFKTLNGASVTYPVISLTKAHRRQSPQQQLNALFADCKTEEEVLAKIRAMGLAK